MYGYLLLFVMEDNMIYKSFSDLIGSTPLFLPQNYIKLHALKAELFLKLEYLNPAGSVKDRVALSMIEDAEKRGILKEGATVIEPTSGNTGIGLAAIAASKGYRAILTMPETMSIERRKLLAAYGAEIVLTEGALGMKGAIAKAEELAKDIPNSFIPSQFDNPANPKAHEMTTGPEIWTDTEGNIDALVAGVGTGGTLSGTGRYLKAKDPKLKVIAVEPADSPLLSEGRAGAHGLQGIGANFVPDNFDRSVTDEIITVTNEEAYQAARELARCEGLLCGITSGAALHAATLVASRPEYKNKRIAVILPDTGDRYLSTPLFS